MAEILLAGAPWGAAGRGAVAEILLPGRAIGKKMLAGGAAAELLAGLGAVAKLLAGAPQDGITIKKESDP